MASGHQGGSAGQSVCCSFKLATRDCLFWMDLCKLSRIKGRCDEQGAGTGLHHRVPQRKALLPSCAPLVLPSPLPQVVLPAASCPLLAQARGHCCRRCVGLLLLPLLLASCRNSSAASTVCLWPGGSKTACIQGRCRVCSVEGLVRCTVAQAVLAVAVGQSGGGVGAVALPPHSAVGSRHSDPRIHLLVPRHRKVGKTGVASQAHPPSSTRGTKHSAW